ncbi:MAG: hypothetical protein ACHRHE_18920 [Tepidisphaerales bacterium]
MRLTTNYHRDKRIENTHLMAQMPRVAGPAEHEWLFGVAHAGFPANGPMDGHDLNGMRRHGTNRLLQLLAKRSVSVGLSDDAFQI